MQLVRYGLVGITLNGLGYLLYLLLTRMGYPPIGVVTVFYPLFVFLSFLLNRAWSFSYRGNFARNLGRFLSAHVIGYLINVGLLQLFSTHLGLPHQLVQLAAVFIVAGFLFILFRYYVYPTDVRHLPGAEAQIPREQARQGTTR